MFFFCKPSKIVVDSFTNIPSVGKFSPIDRAIKFLPEWWKLLPKKYEGVAPNGLLHDLPTMKNCSGFLELYKNSFIIPNWCDLILEIEDNGSWRGLWSESFMASPIEQHPPVQFGDSFKRHIHLKIHCPWLIKEKTGVRFVWTDPTWSNVLNDCDFKVLPGTVEYRHQHSTNINILAPKRKQRIQIEHGSPMVQLTGMTEKTIDLRTHVVDDLEYRKLGMETSYRFKFMGQHRMKMTCPYK